MLIKILKRLVQGGIYSNKVMATELGVDQGLVEQMLDRLLHMGYIEKEKINSCGEGCGSCSGKGSCGSNSIEISMWKVTEKGKRAISA